MIKVPCKGCEERTAECHVTCIRYKEYRKKLDELNKDKKKTIKLSEDLVAYGKDKVERLDRLR